MTIPAPVHPTDVITVEIWDYDVVGQHDFLGSGHFELASLQQGMEKVMTSQVFSGKGTLQCSLMGLNFSVPPPVGIEGNVNANKQIAAESARKRAIYKKTKVARDVGKSTKGALKSLGKLF